jgi:catecholate siderophore receptor
MSEYGRGGSIAAAGTSNNPNERYYGAIRATARNPLSHAALGSIASMVLASGSSAQDTALPQIDVLSDSGSQTYQATNQTITRLPTPRLDTPQTVNVVTERVIKERGAQTLEDALRSVPGITFSAGEGGVQGDAPFINGFSARGDIYRDGVRDPGWYTRDLFSSDRVEVYKGPSAFAFGRGTTGGAINFVSKLPTGASFLDTTVTGYTPSGVRTELDAGGKKDNVSWRIAAMGQNIDTADRDNVWTKRWGVAPSVKVDFTSQTNFTLAYVYQGEESVPDYGHPYLPQPAYSPVTGALTNGGYYGTGQATTPVPIKRSNWFGVFEGPLADVQDTATHIATAKIEHNFTKDIKAVNVTRYVQNDRSSRPTAPRELRQANNVTAVTPLYPVGLMTIGRQHFWTETDNTLLVNQTDFVGKVYTGPIQHTFVAGMELMRETRWQQRANGMDANNLCAPANILCRTSLAFPTDTTFGGQFNFWNPAQDTESKNIAFYASDQMKLNQYFELLGAIRFDRYNTKFEDPGNAVVANRFLERTDNMLGWRVGGVFHPTPNSSIYVAYGTSYNPAAELGTLSGAGNNAANVQLPPEKNNSLEAGVKVDLLNNKLSLTGAVFRIQKTNMRIALDPSLPNNAQVLVLDGEAQVDGVEVGIAGNITDKWQIFAGYSHLETEIKKTRNMAELGRQLPNTPSDSFSLWTTYAVTPEWLIGGGAIYQSDTFVNTTNTAYVPDYWRFDLMTSYKVHKNHTIQLNIYNLTNEMYYAQYYGGHAVPAAGRYAALTWRAKWGD